MRKKDMFDMKVDESGKPVLVQSQQTWFDTLFSAVAYPIRRLFSSKEDRNHKDSEVACFISFLQRIKIRPEKDPLTGLLTPSLFYEVRPLIKKNVKYVHYYEVTAACKDERKAPVVVENKHGTIIYHIQNLTININAEVVTQLNTNPQQVINIIQEQLRAEINKEMKKQELEA